METKRKVQTEEAQQYAKDNDIIYTKTSAKTSLNVRNLFVKIAEKLPKNAVVPERESFPIMPPKGGKDNKRRRRARGAGPRLEPLDSPFAGIVLGVVSDHLDSERRRALDDADDVIVLDDWPCIVAIFALVPTTADSEQCRSGDGRANRTQAPWEP